MKIVLVLESSVEMKIITVFMPKMILESIVV